MLRINGADGRPLLVILDAVDRRRARLETLAITLGARCVAVASMCEAATVVGQVRVVLRVGAIGVDGLGGLRRSFPAARLIVGGLDRRQISAVEALRAGADDFVCLEGGDAELAERIAHHLHAGTYPADVDGEVDAEAERCGLVGDSPPIAQLRRFVRRVARSNATALITGETGAGKECAALLLHRAGARSGGPLVALNCAAIPEELLESELFGHTRGAFSGAVRDHPGKMALANGGTLFLDEVGELNAAGQAKILRAVETREVHPLGARAPRSLDIRVVAATNRDLSVEMAAGRFREDLYYRLAVARIRMPPLRERAEDIPVLARHILGAVIFPKGGAPRLTEAAAERLAAHDWPGNARELRNVLEVACIDSEGGEIGLQHLPHPLRRAQVQACVMSEKARLVEALRRAGGNKAAAARALSCSRMTVYRHLARHGLAKEPDPTA